MTTREQDFEAIKLTLSNSIRFSAVDALVSEGDSVELLKKLPDHSVSLILTDPPYHATKKQNIYGDTAFAEDQHYLEWMAQYAIEWRRVLRTNGSLFCFCDSSMAARLEVMLSERFNILSHVVWTKPNDPGFDGWKGKMKKEALRQWYPHSERIIFAEPAVEGNLHRSPFAQFLREVRKKSGLSGHQLTEITGAYGNVNHGGAVSNWELGATYLAVSNTKRSAMPSCQRERWNSCLRMKMQFVFLGWMELKNLLMFGTFHRFDRIRGSTPQKSPHPCWSMLLRPQRFQEISFWTVLQAREALHLHH